MSVSRIILIALAATAAATSTDLQSSDALSANPIRKVVTMLQSLQKKVTAEGETEAKLFDKFKCYCSGSGGTLKKSISDAEAKVPSVGSDIEESEAKIKQLQEDLKKAKADRAEAKSSMQEATALREKAAAEFAAAKAESSSNIAAMSGAIESIQKGMAGFVQTEVAQHVRRVALNSKDLTDFDRQSLLSFLSGQENSDYAPASDQIVGILKEMKDKMSESLADLESGESSSVASHESLMTSKTKQVGVLSKEIETKTVRAGSLAVQIAQMKEDLEDTQAALQQDKTFLANMDRDCATKTSEYETNVQVRSEELLALADAIKMLNSDDALELFKKSSLPSPSSSFLQMETSIASQQARALALISAARAKAQKQLQDALPSLDFLTLAIRGKKVSFDKVIKMIDGMVVTLKREQEDDSEKHKYCEKQFDSSGDKKKGLERSASDLDTAITKQQDAIATLKDEIEALEDGIKALDKEVASATEQRKEENKDFTELMASNTAAMQLLNLAKTRLHKFYHPKSKQSAAVLVQINEHQQGAPPPAPETSGAYLGAKDDADEGPLSMLDKVIEDLDKGMKDAQTMERDSQRDYEQAMKDSADRRASSSKSLMDKGATKASVEADLEASKSEKGSTVKELMATDKYISSLHGECDFLMQYFDVRKQARDGEIESLRNAKNLLSGMDVSLMQMQKGRNLRGGA